MPETTQQDRYTTTARERRKGPPCTMGLLLRSMSPENAADVRADLANDFVRNTTVRASLKAMGYDIEQSVVDRHARGDCKNCDR
jgi:hypothetical protein